MRTHHTAAVLLAAAAIALTGCSSEPKPDAMPISSPSPAAPASTSSVDRDAARAAAGLPPEPKGAQRKAFLDGLNAIDKDIVHGKDDKAISRGIDTCGLVKNFPGDLTKQVEQTEKRWTSPTHPDGHGQVKAAQILAVSQAAICPTF
ncbi:hypothetical protein [Streptomyces sp. NBC_01264]|uniref:hypothetical protein n=1 Tax=Streptomyces sp. NBC_01264 TaxID=2903804 RepID=UPI00224F843C|nr:hypothetical protein [Streptomyces sp. NBC_01264]MCX4780070.1 hypothetical protein [Streptomyces sp. NBC_01264]